MTASEVRRQLRAKADPDKAAFYPRFFKAGKGEYGEGDKFLGVVVPEQRKVARAFQALPRDEVTKLLNSPYHECRLTGLLILVRQYERAKSERERNDIFKYYFRYVDRINNWDLVDASCYKIVGAHLRDRDRNKFYTLARAKHLWKNRIAIVSTLAFIKDDDFDTTLELAEMLLHHEHDLIHKAVGWMLREVGNRDKTRLLSFLDEHAAVMPRTMLRYAIEKLSKAQRGKFMTAKG